jgi:chorismate mutase/prephenate dehydratase
MEKKKLSDTGKSTGKETKNNKKIQVGYQGVEGAYGHIAAETYFAEKDVTIQNFLSFEDVVNAVAEEKIKYGVLPIENSSTGGITEVYDLIRRYNCYIVGEQCIKVEHCLLACPGSRIEDITEVYSHPQGFAQCRPFFRQYPQMQLLNYYNTAKAAELVAEKKTKHMAAVAGAQAARRYGLEILAKGINANTSNYTRFFVIAKNPKTSIKANKITVVVALKHEPGSLYRMLGCFANNNINMLNIESRPIAGRPWEYFFHIDVSGNLADTNVKKAMLEVKKDVVYRKILGNYVSTQAAAEKEPPLTKNIVLIGMPGVGKTSIGRRLAQKMKVPFFDVDKMIVKMTGHTVKELFSVSEDYFRIQETEAVKVLAQKQGVVIACGGGVILRDLNMNLLHKNGMVFFLNRSPEDIVKDVDTSTRPLLAAGKEKVKELYASRIRKYARYGDYLVDVEEPMMDTLPKIEKLVKLTQRK